MYRIPVDAAQQAARARRRDARIQAGLDDLERWLEDLARVGLAEAASRPWSAFEQMSARLVDAQAPGLARLVRDLGAIPHTAPNWPERMLVEVGRLSLLVEAARQQDTLEPGLRAEVRSLLGISESRQSVLASPPVHDVWDIFGRRVLAGERLSVQRTWLWGRLTRRWALLLDFAPPGQDLDRRFVPGTAGALDLHFYAGALQLRAVSAEAPIQSSAAGPLPGESIDALLRAYAARLGTNPWLERLPAALEGVVPRRGRSETWWLTDATGRRLRLAGDTGWQLTAVSGGSPIAVFGEWDGYALWPLASEVLGRVHPLRPLAAA